MKKVFLFILGLFILPAFVSALSVGHSVIALNNIYGFVHPGDEIEWDNNWYYLSKTGSDGSDCKAVKVLLSDGLSFSKTEKQTIMDLGTKCGWNDDTPGATQNLMEPIVGSKIYVDNAAIGGLKKVTIQFGDEVVDYNVNFMVVKENSTKFDILSGKNQIFNLAKDSDIEYLFYSPDGLFDDSYHNNNGVFLFINDEIVNITDNYHGFSIDNPVVGSFQYNLYLSERNSLLYKMAPLVSSTLEPGDYSIKFVFIDGESLTANLKVINDANYQAKKYNIIEGNNQTLEYKNRSDFKEITFKIDANMDNFSELYIDDDYVPSKNYSISIKDNTVTLSKEFLADINYSGHNEEYSIEFVFNDGSAIGKFNLAHTNSNKHELLNPKYVDYKKESKEKITFDFTSVDSNFIKMFNNYDNVTIFIDGPEDGLYNYYGLFEDDFTIDTVNLFQEKSMLSKEYFDSYKVGRITINNELLNDLAVGEHIITFMFSDGEVLKANIVIRTDEVPKQTELKFISGANQVVNFRKSSELVFSIDNDLKYFLELYVDNVAIPKKYYSLTKGSTIVTFDQEFLNYLKNGEHTLKLNYSNGTASTRFVVNNAEIDNPHTGASISIAVLGLAVIGYVLIKTNKKKIYNI